MDDIFSDFAKERPWGWPRFFEVIQPMPSELAQDANRISGQASAGAVMSVMESKLVKLWTFVLSSYTLLFSKNELHMIYYIHKCFYSFRNICVYICIHFFKYTYMYVHNIPIDYRTYILFFGVLAGDDWKWELTWTANNGNFVVIYGISIWIFLLAR